MTLMAKSKSDLELGHQNTSSAMFSSCWGALDKLCNTNYHLSLGCRLWRKLPGVIHRSPLPLSDSFPSRTF